MHVCIYIRMYTYVSVYIYMIIHLYTHIHARMHTYVYLYISISKYTHTHTHTCYVSVDRSAFHIAAHRGFPDVLGELHRLGASSHLLDATGRDALGVANAWCMHACADVIRAQDAAEGYAEFECAPVECADGREVLVAISGPAAGNCYCLDADPETGERAYVGRLDPDTNLVDPSQPEAFGPDESQVVHPNPMSQGPESAHKNKNEEARAGTGVGMLMEQIKIDGALFWRHLGEGLLFEYEPPHKYVGLQRRNGTIHYGQPPPGPRDYPPQIPLHQRPGRPAFVIGALNGSVEAAREYNRRLHLTAWKDLHEYGCFKLMHMGRNIGYPTWMQEEVGSRSQVAVAAQQGEAAGAAVADNDGPTREAISVSTETRDLIKRRKRRGEFRVVGSQQEPDWLAQIVDGLWEMGETERRFPERFKAVGDDIVRIPQDDHPLWRPGACKCPHCEDMRTGASGMVCHCEHCYTQGYWKQKDLSSLIHLL